MDAKRGPRTWRQKVLLPPPAPVEPPALDLDAVTAAHILANQLIVRSGDAPLDAADGERALVLAIEIENTAATLGWHVEALTRWASQLTNLADDLRQAMRSR